MSVTETLAKLVSIDSVSSRSNVEIISFLSGRAEAAGLRVTRLPYKDEHGVEKVNTIALTGGSSPSAPDVELALVGHTDTVRNPRNPQ